MISALKCTCEPAFIVVCFLVRHCALADDSGGAVVRPVAKRRSVEEPVASVVKQQRGAGWGVAAPPREPPWTPRVAASRVAPVVAPAPVAPPTEGPTLKVHLPSGPRAQQLLEKAQGGFRLVSLSPLFIIVF